MGMLDSVRALLGRGTRYENVILTGPTVSEVLGMGPEDLFRTQPHLRTVITFVARNIAQLPLSVYERVSDTDRRRVTDHPVAALLRRPNPAMTSFELIYALVADLKLYDVALWMLTPAPETVAGWELRPIPPSWVVQTWGGDAWSPEGVEIVSPNGSRSTISGDSLLIFHGYRPGSPKGWVSPVDALKEILAEQIQAWTYRQQVWQRGGRVGAYLTRPVGSPEWSSEARTSFARDWKAKWTGPTGPKAGGTPILEDGMELKTTRFNAREEEWTEVAKLSLATVAAVYHTSPTMVGILDNANYSNVREFHQMLYTDTLGPDLAMIEARINAFLLPRLGADSKLYAEFNVRAKLAGSFEEQTAVLSTSVGRPFMTADEARAMLNMPSLGGDAAALVTPLNVLIGGQASAHDTGSQNRAAARVETRAAITRASADDPLTVKAQAREADERDAEQVLKRFFARQRAVVLTALGAKAPAWWDADRWNRELADDLTALALRSTEAIATETLDELDVPAETYSVARTTKFLQAVAASRAALINDVTRAKVQAALDDDLEEGALTSTPAGVFEEAETSRAAQAGQTLATTLAAFAVTEVGRQLGRASTTKTWLVQSGSPRASHASMHGETVPIDGLFSNGMNWPGDPAGGADEVAGCMCGVEVTIP